MATIRTNLAYVAAVATLLLGLLALLNPGLVGAITGLEARVPRGTSALRATYGAMILAMGGVMLWAAPNRPRSAPWLRFAAVMWLGAALGRATSVVLDGIWSLPNVGTLAVEVALGLMALQGSFKDRPPSRRVAEPERALQATRGERD